MPMEEGYDHLAYGEEPVNKQPGIQRDYDRFVKPPTNTYATPHQEELPVGLGTEKAAGMGKTRRIGLKRPLKTDLYPK